jgi:hypothetical protein
MLRSKFSANMIHGVVVIVDANEGHMSVTNDIENVVAYLAMQFDLVNAPVVYRDSMGGYDGVKVQDGKSFAGFVPMRCLSTHEAIGLAHRMRLDGKL